MATLYDRLNDSFNESYNECVPLSMTLLKNKVKLALVKVAEEYDISIDIIEAILKDKKMTTRFMMPKIRHTRSPLCWAGQPQLFYKKTFIRKCIMTEDKSIAGGLTRYTPDYINICRKNIRINICWTNETPTTKRDLIKYIKEDTSFKKNGGKYKDLQKMNKLQLLEFIVKSPLCD